MAETSVPEAAHRLLRERVFSFEQLAALMYLYGRTTSQAVPVHVVADALRIRRDSAQEALNQLVSGGLVFQQPADPPSFSYQPSSAELGACVEALAHACVEDRLGVLQLMGALAIERTRTNLHKAFASTLLASRKNTF